MAHRTSKNIVEYYLEIYGEIGKNEILGKPFCQEWMLRYKELAKMIIKAEEVACIAQKYHDKKEGKEYTESIKVPGQEHYGIKH